MILSSSSAQRVHLWARFRSDFAFLSASQLGAVAIKAAVERAGVKPELVEEVLFGNCLMAGQGQAPARQALLAAGLPYSTGAVTLSKNVRFGDEGDYDGLRRDFGRQQ